MSLVLKGLDGVLELLGGVLLLIVSPAEMSSLLLLLTQHELSEDPQDLVANALTRLADGLTVSATLFGAAYLLVHGLVKVVLVWAVLRNRLWAYPWMIGFLLIFITYQTYQLVLAFSWGLAALTAFDIFIVWLTWHEYRAHRARGVGSSAQPDPETDPGTNTGTTPSTTAAADGAGSTRCSRRAGTPSGPAAGPPRRPGLQDVPPRRPGPAGDHHVDVRRLRRVVLVVALLNFAYFFVEFGIALAAGSVALLADSVDFLEDTSINLLIFMALGWHPSRRALMGKAMALIILVPAAVAGWEALRRFSDPTAPDVVPVVLASLGAVAVNGAGSWLLVRVRHHGGSLSRAAFLSARNDVLVNVAIIVMAIITVWTGSGWPDLILGCFIVVLALHAAYEVWEAAEEERLGAKALAGEDLG
ncbi:DUF2127 domain-containing protein [Brevibacterium daeguense]|uniref:DUF2127 domain-containing protein n=1 Tax=Brevibacterium daeguense TaxID=909936 RepID=UPI0030160B3F